MGARKKHTEGFTLAELMLSVAVILVLAALAIPSIITAQNNMRIVELDSAAESIANAAQTQMTALKVSGTWLNLIETTADDGSKTVNYPHAANPPSTAPGDTYYLTADQARDKGIVPDLSIDEQLRAGDYIIEFTASTANVVSVFYADGKTGFFGTAPDSTSAARDYYRAGGSRDQNARMANSPMVGYYQGAPASATDAIALENPVIWVDEESGRLCVQDPNLPSLTTSSTVTVKKTDENGAHEFVISGLDGAPAAISISKADPDNPDTKTIVDSADIKDMVELLDREGKAAGNVYFIDLNALVRVFSEAYPGTAVVDILNLFDEDDEVEVSATTALQRNPKNSIPTTARAIIHWPASVGKLSVLVGTPWSKTLAEKEISGANNPSYLSGEKYVQPTVEAFATNGKPSSTILSHDIEELLPFKASDVNSKLVAINKQSGWQTYVGGEVGYAKAAGDSTFVLKATVGYYTTHRYQVWELWARQANGDATRVGYVRDGVWEWANVGGVKYAALENALTWYDENGNAYGAIAGLDADTLERIVSVDVNASAWGDIPDNLGLRDEDGNMTLYLRTAPRASEVQAYYDEKAKNGSLISDMKNPDADEVYTELSARGVNKTVHTSTSVNFETEFGASSSDAAWSIARDADTGFDNGNRLAVDRSAVRVYYSITPGLGFENIRGAGDPLNLRSTLVTNASLFMYLTNNGSLEKQPVARVNRSEPGNYTFKSYAGATDFGLKTEEDYRFYRAVTYYDDDGATKLAIPSQYVPYSAMDVEIAGGADKVSEDGTKWRFIGWTTTDTKSGAKITIAPGDTVADHDDDLSYTGVKLVASYVEVPKPELGIMYLEFDGNNNVSWYYGYTNLATKTLVKGANADNNAISSWGYYALVPAGTAAPVLTQSKNLVSLKEKYGQTVTIDGVPLDAYRLEANDNGKKTHDVPVVMKAVNDGKAIEGTGYVNFNFACAVETSADNAAAWGVYSYPTAESPWIVRHAGQFYGSLPGNGSSNPQMIYRGDAFLQTHDIDMADVSVSYKVIPSAIFTGWYNGGGKAIHSFDRGTYFFNGGNPQGFSANASTGQGQGLFPSVQGASEDNPAVLSNIRLVMNGSEGGAYGTLANASFGFLAGVVENAVVDQCALEGAGTSAFLDLSAVSSNNGTIGLLVGYAVDSELRSCKVANTSLWLSSRNLDKGWTSPMRLGGLVGGGSDIDLVSCSVSSITCVVNGMVSTKNTSYVGGLVGTMSGLGIHGSSATSVSFQVYNRYVTPESFVVGGLVGIGASDIDIDSVTSWSGITRTDNDSGSVTNAEQAVGANL